jgi:hypothetical protein
MDTITTRLARAGALCILLTGSSQSHAANFIREQGGTLTTDLPGVTIFPFGPPGTEAWAIVTDTTVWQAVVNPPVLAEPDAPGKENIFLPGPIINHEPSMIWTSDVPPFVSILPAPSPALENWITQDGRTVQVIFEDLGDAAVAVPDTGSSFVLLGLSLLLVGASRVRRTGAS